MKTNLKKEKKQLVKDTKKTQPDANVLMAQCPSREILNNVTSKWGVLIFHVLAKSEVKRFSEIRREIEGISEKMLTQTLKALEADHFIIRKSYNVVPPYVEYSLSPSGKDVADRVINLVQWIESNLNKIKK